MTAGRQPPGAVSWRGRHRQGYARLLIAGGSLADRPARSLDPPPDSWLMLALGFMVLAGLIGLVVFVL